MRLHAAIRTIAHDESLSLVDHLDELRTRLLVSLAVVAIAFGFCFWQNHALLHLINSPLAHQTQQQVRDGHGPLGATYQVQRSARDIAVQLHSVVGVLEASSSDQSTAVQPAPTPVGAGINRDITRLPSPPRGARPVTLGLGQPLPTSVTVPALRLPLFKKCVLTTCHLKTLITVDKDVIKCQNTECEVIFCQMIVRRVGCR